MLLLILAHSCGCEEKNGGVGGGKGGGGGEGESTVIDLVFPSLDK